MDNAIEGNAGRVDFTTERRPRLSEFVVRAAYAIRSPINIILGYNELIAQRMAALGDDSQRPYLESISRSGRQIIETINRIIDYSRIDEGSLRLAPERIELAGLVEKLVQDYRVLAAAKKLGLICEVEEPAAALYCDAYCLTNALSNLVDNAIKFTAKGGAVIKVCRDGQGRLSIEVRDTGAGFDPEQLIRSMEPRGGDNGERRERVGLGLMLARKYLDLIGASLAMSSSPAKGSAFTISFPQTVEAQVPVQRDGGPAASEKPAPAALGVPPPQPAAAAHATVVVVDDQRDQALFVRALLQNRYPVAVAANASETLALLAELGGRAGLIVMDIALAPGEDGLTLAARIHADRRWQHLPIVVISAHAFAEDRERALAAGAAAYLAKPINAAELLATIEGLLD